MSSSPNGRHSAADADVDDRESRYKLLQGLLLTAEDELLLRAKSNNDLDEVFDQLAVNHQAIRRNGNGHRTSNSKLAIWQSFDDIIEHKWEFWWPKRVAYGTVAVLGGDGDSGKTWTLIDLACRGSTGTALPGEIQTARSEPASVVILNHEDDAERELKRRMRLCRGDQTRIFLWQGVTRPEGEDIPDLSRDLAACEEILTDTSARVLIIDPLTAYLGKTKIADESEVRRALLPLTQTARRLNVAVLGVMHPRKGEDLKALNMLLGSVAFKNVARSVMVVGYDPQHDGRRVLLHRKSNNKEPAPGLGFRINDDGIHWDNDPVTCTAEDIFAPNAASLKKEQTTGVQRACDLLKDQLSGGRQPCDVLYKLAEDKHGISRDTLYDAKNKLGVVIKRDGFGAGSVVYWALP